MGLFGQCNLHLQPTRPARAASASLALVTAFLRQARYASHKAASGTNNHKDSHSKRLGIKKFGGEQVIPGNIIVRQRGLKFHPGPNVTVGRDHTLLARIPGQVHFYSERASVAGPYGTKELKTRKYIQVVNEFTHALAYDSKGKVDFAKAGALARTLLPATTTYGSFRIPQKHVLERKPNVQLEMKEFSPRQRVFCKVDCAKWKADVIAERVTHLGKAHWMNREARVEKEMKDFLNTKTA